VVHTDWINYRARTHRVSQQHHKTARVGKCAPSRVQRRDRYGPWAQSGHSEDAFTLPSTPRNQPLCQGPVTRVSQEGRLLSLTADSWETAPAQQPPRDFLVRFGCCTRIVGQTGMSSAIPVLGVATFCNSEQAHFSTLCAAGSAPGINRVSMRRCTPATATAATTMDQKQPWRHSRSCVCVFVYVCFYLWMRAQFQKDTVASVSTVVVAFGSGREVDGMCVAHSIAQVGNYSGGQSDLDARA
jgi:hypothetical protein